ncbi:MAG: NADPH-dependent FMN reductase [Catenulispora sp.]
MVEVLLLCGSVRRGSSNEAMLRLVQDVAGDAYRTVRYEGLGDLPHFNPDLDGDPLPLPVAELRAAIAHADAILVCTPEYAGTLPGSFKNLLDWTVGGTEIGEKPTAWINAANPGRGEGAVATLRMVLEYTGAAIVEEACVRIAIGDPEARSRIAEALVALHNAAAHSPAVR